MKKFFAEFKEFISKGNVMDLAIGVIVGGMFTKIVNSLTNDIIMPFVSLVTGRTTFENMFLSLDGNHYTTPVSYTHLISLKNFSKYLH